MLTILRAISQYGGLNLEKPVKGLRNDFKIIYVAPMKALAAEIVRKMGKRLGWLGTVVKELTGKLGMLSSFLCCWY
jgi:antiviral helicase SLH1